MERLFLHLSMENDRVMARWALYAGTQETASLSERAALDAALARAIPAAGKAERQIIAIIPGVDVTLVTAEIQAKQRRHMKKMLSFLAEEKLAEDTGLLHLAASENPEKPGELLIAAISRERMQIYYAALANADLSAHVMLPETVLMPEYADEISLVCERPYAWLRSGSNPGMVFEQDMLALALQLMLEEQVPNPPLRLFCPSGELAMKETLQRAWPKLVIETEIIASAGEGFRQGYLSRDDADVGMVNLLQGEFSARPDSSVFIVIAKRLCAVLACWLALQVGLWQVESIYYDHKGAALREEMTQTYQQLFPADSKIINPVQQMKEHLAHDMSDGSKGFLPLLKKVAAHWQTGGGGMQMQNITFREDQQSLSFNLSAKSIEALYQLSRELNASGLNATLLSVVNDRDGARAQLSVKEK